MIVNFSNPIKELTKQQVISLFSGGILDRSELDEKADGKLLMARAPTTKISLMASNSRSELSAQRPRTPNIYVRTNRS